MSRLLDSALDAERRQAIAAWEPAYIEPEHIDAAESRVLADMDLFQEWLGGELQHKRAEFWPSSDEVTLMRQIERATVPQLQAAIFYPHERCCFLAAREMRNRYMKAQERHILKLAAAEVA